MCGPATAREWREDSLVTTAGVRSKCEKILQRARPIFVACSCLKMKECVGFGLGITTLCSSLYLFLLHRVDSLYSEKPVLECDIGGPDSSSGRSVARFACVEFLGRNDSSSSDQRGVLQC